LPQDTRDAAGPLADQLRGPLPAPQPASD
jgi:hypothetical protein